MLFTEIIKTSHRAFYRVLILPCSVVVGYQCFRRPCCFCLRLNVHRRTSVRTLSSILHKASRPDKYYSPNPNSSADKANQWI